MAGRVTPARAESDDARARPFLGTYQYAGGKSEQDKAYEAVEAAIADLNDMIQGIARKRLRDSATASPRFLIDVERDRLVLGPPEHTIDAPLDGSARTWSGPYGGLYKVSYQIGDTIVQRIKGVVNGSDTRKVFRRTGDRMTISITINHSMLSGQLRYRHTYRS
ncbi:MAG: hypothetical protein KC636_09155 [Myxococcales bacterium]|nr:hypothetical protein [Myxococcales bacterium]